MNNKKIARLAYADVAFKDALAICEALTSPDIDHDSHLYFGMVSGMAVSYCRPFMESNCLGRLEEEYANFPTEQLKSTHCYIKDARNALVAHSDFSFQKRIANEFQLKDPTKIELTLAEFGVMANTNPITIPKRFMSHAK